MAVSVRLVAEWAGRYGIRQLAGVPSNMSIRRDVWDHVQVGEHLDRMAKLEPRIITNEIPRRMTGPLVLVDFGSGRIGQLDGRRRANLWRNLPGRYEVLILCVS